MTLATISGCGADIEEPEPEPEIVPAQFVSANPPSGSEIASNGIITLAFDNIPINVTANVGTVVLVGKVGKVVSIEGPFTSGPFHLVVTWADGTQTLTYTVNSPCAPPLIYDETVAPCAQ